MAFLSLFDVSKREGRQNTLKWGNRLICT
jgi:hypothetical protein